MIEREDLTARARRIEEIGMEILRGWQAEDPRVGDVRGRGAMLAVELIDPVTGHPDAALTGAPASGG